MDPGDYVITFNGGLSKKLLLEMNLSKTSLTYEDYLDIESLANKLQIHSHAITKTVFIPSNRDIGRYTIHESQLVNMPVFLPNS